MNVKRAIMTVFAMRLSIEDDKVKATISWLRACTHVVDSVAFDEQVTTVLMMVVV